MTDDDGLTIYRVTQLEQAVETMAAVATSQAAFNTRVETFMTAARTWGRVGLILYGTGQALLIGVILYAIDRGFA